MTTFHSGTAAPVRTLVSSIFQMLGLTYDLSRSPSFRVVIDCPDGVGLAVTPSQYEGGPPFRTIQVPPTALQVPSGGGTLDKDVSEGTTTLVASTKDVTVDCPTGSTVYAAVTTGAGKTKQLTAARVDDSTIRISSPGDGYAALLESAGVAGTLVAGTTDIALANVAGDRLAVVMEDDNGGTPGVLSVKRKSNTEVTVESWVDGTGVQALDVSDVKVYNFGQKGHETSVVRWAVVRP